MKILLVDDHNLFRKTLSRLIITFEEVTEVEEAANGLEALEVLARKKIDTVFMDVRMPVMDGFDCCARISTDHPTVNIVILTEIDSRPAMLHFIQSGVKGFLTKNTDPAEIQMAIREIKKGECYFPQDIMCSIKNSLGDLRNDLQLSMSKKERKIMTLLERGLTSKELAQLMQLSTKTVNSYREQLLKKTSTKNVAELISWGYKNGILI